MHIFMIKINLQCYFTRFTFPYTIFNYLLKMYQNIAKMLTFSRSFTFLANENISVFSKILVLLKYISCAHTYIMIKNDFCHAISLDLHFLTRLLIIS